MFPLFVASVCGIYVGQKLLKISTKDKESKQALKNFATEINFILENAKIYTEREGVINNAYCTFADKQLHYMLFGVFLPTGKSKKDLENVIPALVNYFRCEVEILDDNHHYKIKVITSKLENRYDYEFVPVKDTDHLYATIGMTISGAKTFNLSSDVPDLFVAGLKGSGKSKFLQAVTCNMIENYTAKQLHIYYCCNKRGLETQEFEGVEHVQQLTETLEECCDLLKTIYLEMEDRFVKLKSWNKKGFKLKKLPQYNKAVPEENRLPFIFVVIDEIYDFTSFLPKSKGTNDLPWLEGGKPNQDEVFGLLGLMLSLCRAVGIHFAIGTQRPTSDCLPTKVSCHLSGRIGFRTSTKQESINIIEESGLEEIPANKQGRGIAKAGGCTEFQSFYIDDSSLDKLCAKYRVAKPKPIRRKSKKKLTKENIKEQIEERLSADEELAKEFAEELGLLGASSI